VCYDDLQDVCDYSHHQLYLLTDGSIRCQDRVIRNNRQLIIIVVFNGHVYGVDKFGDLHQLNHHYEDSNHWIWKSVPWAPRHIRHVSITLDNKHMWIETNKHGYLFDPCYKQCCKIKHDGWRRVYGKNTTCYLAFKDQQCDIVIDNCQVKTIKHVVTGVMDYHHHIHVLNTNDYLIYKNVRLVNHKPYYINR